MTKDSQGQTSALDYSHNIIINSHITVVTHTPEDDLIQFSLRYSELFVSETFSFFKL